MEEERMAAPVEPFRDEPYRNLKHFNDSYPSTSAVVNSVAQSIYKKFDASNGKGFENSPSNEFMLKEVYGHAGVKPQKEQVHYNSNNLYNDNDQTVNSSVSSDKEDGKSHASDNDIDNDSLHSPSSEKIPNQFNTSQEKPYSYLDFGDKNSNENGGDVVRLLKCNVCDKLYKKMAYLKNHMKTQHTGMKPFTCGICKKSFSVKNTLTQHMLTHTGEKPHQCNECGKRFSMRTSLYRHLRIHSGEKAHECSVCHKKFVESCTLKTHMLIHTGEKPFTCEICYRTFRESSSRKKHMRTHTGEKPYRCLVCEKAFTNNKSLKSHMASSHTASELQLAQAEKDKEEAEKRAEMNANAVNLHNQETTGNTDDSQANNKTQNETLEDQIYNYQSLKFDAEIDDLNNEYISNLEKQMIRKDRWCDICKKLCKKKSEYQRHMLTHTGEKPFLCGFCQRPFRLKNTLNKHILTHTGEKPHKCHICGRKFTARSALVRHFRIHSGEKEFECPVCHKLFGEKGNMKNHMMIHTGERPYECNICKRLFREPSTRKRHMKTHKGHNFVIHEEKGSSENRDEKQVDDSSQGEPSHHNEQANVTIKEEIPTPTKSDDQHLDTSSSNGSVSANDEPSVENEIYPIVSKRFNDSVDEMLTTPSSLSPTSLPSSSSAVFPPRQPLILSRDDSGEW